MRTDTTYYQVTGGEPLEFCRDWRNRTKAGEQVFSDYAKAKGGVGFVRVTRNRFGGVIFSGAEPTGWRLHRRACADGTQFAKPVVRGAGAAEGKVFQAEMDALPLLPDDDEFADRFGFPATVEYTKPDGSSGTAHIRSSFYRAIIAWVNDGDSFWVVLPNLEDRVAELHRNGWAVTPDSWVIPEGMIASTRARYELAIAANKVAQEEALSPGAAA